MSKIEELESRIQDLKDLISRGKEFEMQGFDCDTLQTLNYALLNNLEKELGELDG